MIRSLLVLSLSASLVHGQTGIDPLAAPSATGVSTADQDQEENRPGSAVGGDEKALSLFCTPTAPRRRRCKRQFAYRQLSA